MSILKEISLRYRGEGHARFDIPQTLCQPERAGQLTTALRKIDGVYRVDVFSRPGKLSIRYLPTTLGFHELIRALAAIVTAEMPVPTRDGVRSGFSALSRLKPIRPIHWLREKLQEARETLAALKIVVRHQFNKSSGQTGSGDLIVTFLNDVLVFYLIKVHWNLITRYWLKRPFEYRYPWLATFYLLFLLIRYRQARLNQ